MRQASPDLASDDPVALSLFRHPWRFVTEAPSMDALPPEGPPEVAFAGRSNVGKSSLINALTGQSNLARKSTTPGRTQALIFFVPDRPAAEPGALPPIALVDMPGYGYAKAPKETVAAWTSLMRAYFAERRTLKRVFLLVDARHGLKPADETLMDELDRAAVSYQAVLTKADKISAAELGAAQTATEAALRRRAAAYPVVLATSSARGSGLDALKAEITGFSSAG